MPWLIKRHYAKRPCSISYAFGLYDEKKELQGVCTFGFPPNQEYNDGACVFDKRLSVLTLELNRLIVNEGLPKNSLSFFVARCLGLLPHPCCIVSYSDPNNGHHGYIYQATNWLYTGTSTTKYQYEFADGSTFDIRRGIDTKGEIVGKTKLLPTHRYLMFLGTKKQKRDMMSKLKWKVEPYPKGENRRYDTGEKFSTQSLLF
jgi:hypothetical protein